MVLQPSQIAEKIKKQAKIKIQFVKLKNLSQIADFFFQTP